MTQGLARPRIHIAPWAVISVLPLLLVGCAEYLARSDTLAPSAGEAVNANIAKQVIDPWPRAAARVDATTDGDRLQHAMERYRTSAGGGSAPQTTSGATTGTTTGSSVPASR